MLKEIFYSVSRGKLVICKHDWVPYRIASLNEKLKDTYCTKCGYYKLYRKFFGIWIKVGKIW